MAGLKVPVEVQLKQNNFESKLTNLFNKLQRQADKLNVHTSNLSPELKKATVQAAKLGKELGRNTSIVDSLGRKLKGLFAAYGGVMTIRAVVQASDTITGAENKLNYINGGNTNATQEQMDKMYAAALRSRTGYGDMLANVSKSMMLSGDVFGGNIDNAIRFQEVMAKSYAIGGASAAEQSSSMYQMIQALGSGRLQGDELRSVTEGAPMAAKAIEKYAQKLYNTTDALKDMGSQGLITSEVVVAAMMEAGEGIDEAFKNTDMTIAQAFTNMKTIAMNSFRLIQDTINKFINSDTGARFFNGMAKAIQFAMGLLNGIVSGFIWLATVITDNWNVIAPILTAVGIILTMFIGYLIGVKLAAIATQVALALAGVAGASSGLATFIAWTMANWPLLLAILLIGVLIAIAIKCGYTIADIVGWVVGVIFAAVAVIWNIIVVAVTIIIMIIVGLGMTIWNIIMALVNFIVACFNIIVTFFYNLLVADIANGVLGLVSVFQAALENIGIFFSNLWYGASATFWDFIHEILAGLSDLEPAFNALAKLFGLEGVTLSGLTASAQSKADSARSKIKSYNDIGDAWASGSSTFQRKSYGDAWNSGINTVGYADAIGAFDSIANFSNGLMLDVGGAWNKGNEMGKGFAEGVGDKLGGLSEQLGITGMPNTDNPALELTDVGGDAGKALGDTADNTGKIKDSMELTQEDLEYLRKVADMEWKKEFTTANIIVDMKNNNTINNQGDLDGWVTLLSDKLYEELGMVADGVYE